MIALLQNGHGSSIGSIGEDATYGEVENVTIKNIVFKSTVNCARLKTWQGGQGFIRNILFQNLTLSEVGLPMVIDQYYCPSSQHPGPCANSSLAVAISNVSFLDIQGSQNSGSAGGFNCSDSVPCQNIQLSNIKITGTSPNIFRCWEAYGTAQNVSPPSCLSQKSQRVAP